MAAGTCFAGKSAGAGSLLHVITYNAAVSAGEKGKQWQQALFLLTAVRSNDFSPNVITINAAISACEKCEKWQQALGLLAAAINADLRPNTTTYGAAISACGKGELWQRALGLQAAARRLDSLPDLINYSVAMTASAKFGRSGTGQDVLWMQKILIPRGRSLYYQGRLLVYVSLNRKKFTLLL